VEQRGVPENGDSATPDLIPFIAVSGLHHLGHKVTCNERFNGKSNEVKVALL